MDYNKINIDLLRQQRNLVLDLAEEATQPGETSNSQLLHGLANLLDDLLDQLEGF
tara:strand:- start:563 stop:727 length:165 start_codon:yes stop_codon:yes gene_type:complete